MRIFSIALTKQREVRLNSEALKKKRNFLLYLFVSDFISAFLLLITLKIIIYFRVRLQYDLIVII
jgi:hypothetical protein